MSCNFMADKHTNCHLKNEKNSEIIEFVINSTEADSFFLKVLLLTVLF